MKLSILTLALVLVAIPIIAQASDYKTPTCSLASLKGTFGGAAHGWVFESIPGLPPPPIPFVAVGLNTYDGAGHFSNKSTISMGGFIVPWSTTNNGTYAVTRDCSFSAVQTAKDGTLVTLFGTITGRGVSQEIHVMYIDAYWTISGMQRRTPPGGCSMETMKGTYGLFGEGFVTLPNLPPLLPGNHVGIFAADGKGYFSGEDTSSVAGVVRPDAFNGEYTAINPDCSVSVLIHASDGDFHEEGTITGVGNYQEGHLIITEPGWVFSETAKKQ